MNHNLADLDYPFLLNTYGSPLFIYSESLLELQALPLRDVAAQHNTKVFYSMKANPNPFVLRTFRNLGFGIEVASGAELLLALKVGYEPKMIFFTAPAKTEEEIMLAITNRILAINVDNLQELEVIERMSRESSHEVRITIRVHQTLTQARSRGLKMSGSTVQFGVDEEELFTRLQQKSLSPNVHLIGLHTFQGSENFNIDVYEESWEQLFSLVSRIRGLGLQLQVLGLGGGMGYVSKDSSQFDLKAFSDVLSKVVDHHRDIARGMLLFLESGNYLTRHCGFYLTQVLYTKHRGDVEFVFTDGGTHHISPDSKFTAVLGAVKRDIILISDQSCNETVISTVVGKLCTPTDILGYRIPMKKLKSGDVLVFTECGAYSLTSSRSRFLSHDEPAELFMTKERQVILAKQRKAAIEFFDTDSFIKVFPHQANDQI